MNRYVRAVCCLAIAAATASFVIAQKKRDSIEIVPPRAYTAPELQVSARLQSILDAAVGRSVAAGTGEFKREDVAATLIDLREPGRFSVASVRGEERIYPASVVKMFYMTALERQLEDGKITMTPELARGLRDMIVDSSNEATQYILDVLTDTSSGAERPPKEFAEWQYKRNRVNRFFTAMGFTNINVNQKTFCEDAYGIEQQSRNYKGENRNMLTTNATARLLAEIVSGRMNTPERTKVMMDLMSRDWTKPSDDSDNQAVGFTGKALIDMKLAGTKLWSKAGWTSKARHDAAYVETPDGLKFVLVVFTENHANDREFIPAVATGVIRGLRDLTQ
jgi:beta-lactamase class A